MQPKKHKCALEGCNKMFVPNVPVRIYCSVKCSEAANYFKDKVRQDRRRKGKSVKDLRLHNGLKLANNIISKGVLSE